MIFILVLFLLIVLATIVVLKSSKAKALLASMLLVIAVIFLFLFLQNQYYIFFNLNNNRACRHSPDFCAIGKVTSTKSFSDSESEIVHIMFKFTDHRGFIVEREIIKSNKLYVIPEIGEEFVLEYNMGGWKLENYTPERIRYIQVDLLRKSAKNIFYLFAIFQ